MKVQRYGSPNSFILLFFSAVYGFLSIFFSIYADDIFKASDSWTSGVAFTVSIGFFTFFIVCLKVTGTVFLFCHAYIVALLIFHVSHIFLDAFSIYAFPVLNSGTMSIFYEKAGWAVVSAMFGFIAGGLLGLLKGGYTIKKQRSDDLFFWIGVGLLAVSCLGIIHTTLKVGSLFAYSRTELFSGVGDTRGFGVAMMLLPTSLLFITIFSKPKWRTASILISGFFILLILFLGYRSVALFPLLIGVICWKKVGRKLPALTMILILVFTLIAIPTVRYLRALGPYNEMTSEQISASLDQAEVDDVFLELGAILGIVAYTIKWVPDQADFRFGTSYLDAILNSFPNFGANVAISARDIHENNSYINDGSDLKPADWFIYRYNRWMFENGGGSGFSSIAEAYLNFGYFGVIVVFFITGYFLARLDKTDMLSQTTLLAVSLVLLWPLIKIVRNDFGNFTKPISFVVLVSIFCYFIIVFLKPSITRYVKSPGR